MPLHPPSLLYALDLFGTASFAVSGALRAMHRRPDFVGMVILATATAIGGGTLRDVLLRRDLVALHDAAYPLVILLATAAVFCFPKILRPNMAAVRYADALGL